MSSPITEKQLKVKAIQYYRENSVLSWMEQTLNRMFLDEPKDTAGYLCHFFKQHAQAPQVLSIKIDQVLDGCSGMLYRILVEGQWLQQSENLAQLMYEIPRGHNQLTGLVEHDSHAEIQSLIKEEILLNIRDKQLTWSHLESTDKKLRLWYDRYITTRQKQQDFQTIESERTEAPSKNAGPPTKSPVQSNKPKASQPGTLIVPHELTDPAPPAAVHSSATSMALLMAACNSLRPSMEFYQAVNRIAVDLLASSDASIPEDVPISRNQLPLPIITMLNGTGMGASGPGQQCKCLRHILLIPKPDLSPTEICENLFRCKRQVDDMLSAKPAPGVQMLCSNGAPAMPMDRPEKGLDFVLDALQQLQLKDQILLGLHLASRAIFDQVKGKYEPVTGMQKTPEEMVNYYADLVAKYPQIQLLIEPFRKEDAECWSMLYERIGSQTLLATTNIPQPTMNSGSGGTSGRGPRKPSTIVQTPRLGSPSGPSIAMMANWNQVKRPESKQSHSGPDQVVGPISNSNTVTESGPDAQSSKLVEEEPLDGSGVQKLEEEEEEKKELSYSTWYITTEALLDCCLVTELIQATRCVHAKNKQIVFDVESMKLMDVMPIDIAIGLSFSFVKMGGLGLPDNAKSLLHWHDTVSKCLTSTQSDSDQRQFKSYSWTNFGRSDTILGAQ